MIIDHRRIVCAAIRNENGAIICSPRHFDKLMREQIQASTEEFPPSSEQGFVDQFGNFINREKALKIAILKEQIIRNCGGDDKELFSENLY